VAAADGDGAGAAADGDVVAADGDGVGAAADGDGVGAADDGDSAVVHCTSTAAAAIISARTATGFLKNANRR